MATYNELCEFVNKYDALVDYFENYIPELDIIGLDFDELTEKLCEQNAFDHEVIYYSTAMEYLQNNDASLCESLELAREYGYTLNDINASILATLHKSNAARETWEGLRDEIDEFLLDIIEKEEVAPRQLIRRVRRRLTVNN